MNRDVAVPVGVVRLERHVLAHKIQVGTGPAWDLEEALAPSLFAGDLCMVLQEDGVEPALELERQAQAQRDNTSCIVHEAEHAGNGSG
jgi:hypothetical protein